MSPELPEALRVAIRVIEALEDLGLRYHVGGSYASSIHGIPRQTQDIDLVVEMAVSDGKALASKLGHAFYVDEETARLAVPRKGSFNLIHLASGIKVDVFVRGDEPFDLVEFERHRAEVVQVEPERSVFVKTPEDILLRKLQWFRMGGEVSDRQWSDIQGINETQGQRMDREYLSRWARALEVEDLLKKLETDN